jgi:hypothetical protein
MTTKYKNILFSGLLASVILVTASCTEQDPATGASTLSASSPNVTIQADDFQNIPGVEADATYTYTINLSEPQIADVKFEVFQSGGTATEHEDFDLGESSIVIPAYETSASGSLTIYGDTEPEDQETLQITIGDASTANVNFTPQVYDFVLDNFVSDVLDISFDFCIDVVFGGDVYLWSDFGGDIDVLISSVDDFDINDPWASALPYYGAATGDCPEHLTLDKAELGDGEYVLWHDLYGNVNSGFWESKLVNVTATFVQAGLFRKTVVQDDSQAQNVQDPGGADGNYAGTRVNGIVAYVTIAGDDYIIKDYDGNEVLSGKMVDGKMRTPRPAELNKVNSSPRFSK